MPNLTKQEYIALEILKNALKSGKYNIQVERDTVVNDAIYMAKKLIKDTGINRG